MTRKIGYCILSPILLGHGRVAWNYTGMTLKYRVTQQSLMHEAGPLRPARHRSTGHGQAPSPCAAECPAPPGRGRRLVPIPRIARHPYAGGAVKEPAAFASGMVPDARRPPPPRAPSKGAFWLMVPPFLSLPPAERRERVVAISLRRIMALPSFLSIRLALQLTRGTPPCMALLVAPEGRIARRLLTWFPCET